MPSGRQREINGAVPCEPPARRGGGSRAESGRAHQYEPSVGSQEAAVHVGRHADVGKPGDQLFAPVGHAVAVGVFQPPEARRRRQYTAPSCQTTPCGNVILSANTVLWSKRPSPSVSSSMRISAADFCSAPARQIQPAESATYSRPRSSNQASIGCSTSGGPAASSTVKPGGTRIACEARRRGRARIGGPAAGDQRQQNDQGTPEVANECFLDAWHSSHAGQARSKDSRDCTSRPAGSPQWPRRTQKTEKRGHH